MSPAASQSAVLWAALLVLGLLAVLIVLATRPKNSGSEGFASFRRPHDASAYPLDSWSTPHQPSVDWSTYEPDHISGWSDPYFSTDALDATSGEYTDPRVCSACSTFS